MKRGGYHNQSSLDQAPQAQKQLNPEEKPEKVLKNPPLIITVSE